jgi:AICAR transformylase/IMP cyclohydrolase PurH
MEFEVSFWMLRDANKEDDVFLKLIDGKKPQEIIEMAKTLYQERKNTGFKEYEQYASWDDMIHRFSQDRTKQDETRKGKEEDDFKNGKTGDGKRKAYPSVLYNPRSPQK